MASIPIHSVQTVSGNQARVRRISEKETQTFLMGTPVQLTAGYLAAWDGVTIPFGIAGFSLSAASNLTTHGVPKTLTFGSVPNESSAVNIPRGAPLNDGRCDFETATQDTIFRGLVGPSQTVTQANVGIKYGMTIDSDGYWYVDTTKTTVGTNTVLTVTKLDPVDQGGYPLSTPPSAARGVYFTIDAANTQDVG